MNYTTEVISLQLDMRPRVIFYWTLGSKFFTGKKSVLIYTGYVSHPLVKGLTRN